MDTIYDFVKKEEIKYSQSKELESGWDWCMKDHLRRSFLYKNSQFEDRNEDRHLRPNKNIVLGILNVSYRTEGFDVKDIELFIDNPDEYWKSFLVRKYHEKWALDNGIDTFIDEMVESYVDYGGVLVKNIGEKRPEVIDLRTIAFCSHSELLANPFGFKRSLSQSQLREMKEAGWGEESNGADVDLEQLIVLTKDEPSIDVYEIYGVLPKEYLQDEYHEVDEEKQDEMQLQIVAYYKKKDNNKEGVTLFKSRIPDLGKMFKLLKRDDIKGRALGRGGVEELFEPQKWTNWNEIKITEYLEAASKIIDLTDNPSVVSKHKKGLKDLDHHDLVEVLPGTKGVWQLDNIPRNLPLFDRSVENWEQNAQKIGSATDPLQGETPPSGTPFKLYERQSIEAKGMHSYRRGKIAVFMDEIYRDWVLPHIQKEIVKGKTFLEELSSDEMMEISERIAENYANKVLVERVLEGKTFLAGDKDILMQKSTEKFNKSNKKFIKIIKDEFKDKEIGIRTNIAGKQKNLDAMTDKLVGVLRQWMQMRASGVDTSGLDNILNTILESSGLSPVMFGYNQPQQQNASINQGAAPDVGGGQNLATSVGAAVQG